MIGIDSGIPQPKNYTKGLYSVSRIQHKSFAEVELASNIDESFISIEDTSYKIVLHLNHRFYHLIFENLALVVSLWKENKDLRFIILVNQVSNESWLPHVVFFFKVLNILKIKHQTVPFLPGIKLAMYNFGYYSNDELNELSIKILLEELEKIIPNKNEEKIEKVYLSRKYVPYPPHNFMFGGDEHDIEKLSIKDDHRIKNEELLEEYLSSIGFQIVYPEDFMDFEEQIHFMRRVKVLCSVTSAGLCNMIFMDPGETVVELSTPLLVQGDIGIHLHYYGISRTKRLNYISIPNDREAKELIDRCEIFFNREGFIGEDIQ